MAYWPGLLMLLAGAWLVAAALRRRARVGEEAARGEAPPPLHPSLVLMADLGPSLIRFGLVFAAAQVVLAWLVTDGAGFALFDLAGFLLLLVAYDFWVRTRTRHRPAARQ